MIAIYTVWYTIVKMHKALKMTPALAANVFGKLWSMDDLVGLVDAHDAAKRTADLGDDGTNDLIVSEVIRTNELQAWFVTEHLVETPLVRA